MISPKPATLEANGIRLEPLSQEHLEGLKAAAADGKLWELWYTSVPTAEETQAYLDNALKGQKNGDMLPWAVRDLKSGQIVGSTRYHDIIAAADRVEIGYTWYAKRCQRSHVNTTCKLLLFSYGFEELNCKVVGCAPTTSISRRSAPSRPWARRRTASCATTGRGAMAASATPSCTACWRRNGPT